MRRAGTIGRNLSIAVCSYLAVVLMLVIQPAHLKNCSYILIVGMIHLWRRMKRVEIVLTS